MSLAELISSSRTPVWTDVCIHVFRTDWALAVLVSLQPSRDADALHRWTCRITGSTCCRADQVSLVSFTLCMLSMDVARSSSGGAAIRYVLPVLWMTSYLRISQGSPTWPSSWWKHSPHAALGLDINGAYEYRLKGQLTHTHGPTFRVPRSGPTRLQWACLIFMTSCFYIMSLHI